MNTILIADDHSITREPLARVLRYEGYHTLTAANGLEALDLLRRGRPDLILLDMMMPKMNGVAFLEAASRERAGDAPGPVDRRAGMKGVPVILMTGIAEGPDLARARELGVAEVLPKSKFTLDELLGRIRALIPAADGT